MDDELLRLAKEVTEYLQLEYDFKPLKGDFVKTSIRAELNMGDTTYVYTSDLGGRPVIKAMIALKQYIDNLERR